MCLGFKWHGSVQISNGVQILNGKISHFVCSAKKSNNRQYLGCQVFLHYSRNILHCKKRHKIELRPHHWRLLPYSNVSPNPLTVLHNFLNSPLPVDWSSSLIRFEGGEAKSKDLFNPVLDLWMPDALNPILEVPDLSKSENRESEKLKHK